MRNSATRWESQYLEALPEEAHAVEHILEPVRSSATCWESLYPEALPEESHAVEHILVPDAQLGSPLGVPVPRSPI